MKQSWNDVPEALSFLGFQNSILSWFFTCLTGLLLFSCPVVSWLFLTPWAAAHQASLSLTISQSLPKFMFISLVMPSSRLILWHPLLPLLDLIAVFSLSPSLQMLECPSSGLCFSSLSLSLGDLIHFQGVNHQLRAGESQTVLSNPQLFHIQPANYLTSAHQWLVIPFNLSVSKAKFLSSSTHSPNLLLLQSSQWMAVPFIPKHWTHPGPLFLSLPASALTAKPVSSTFRAFLESTHFSPPPLLACNGCCSFILTSFLSSALSPWSLSSTP